MPRALLAIPIALLILFPLAGCGGSDDGSGTAERPAPASSEFPAPRGQSLEQVLSVASGEGPVVSPAVRVLREGENRFSFGVFTVEHEPVDDAEVAIYAARGVGLKGRAVGPFPARIIDLTTEPAFRAETTANDPDAAQVAYVSKIVLNAPGPWTFAALTRQGGSFGGSLLATPSKVGEFDPPAVGDAAPAVHTPTAREVAQISEIDTRVPPDDMHDEDLAEVLGQKPVVLLFATPALCESRVCGPVVDAALQVKREFGDRVAFIHQEIYNDNQISAGARQQVRAYELPSEPWLYVIARDGRVSAAIEGPFSVAELETATREVASPQSG